MSQPKSLHGPSKRRAILTPQLAREIFNLSIKNGASNSEASSTKVATKYQVSPKTIRDIWCGRCWLEATSDLWNEIDRPQARLRGQSKGQTDCKPRKSRSKWGVSSVEKESSTPSLGTAQDTNFPPRIPFATFSPVLSHPFIPRDNQWIYQSTHQVLCTGETMLAGKKSVIPNSFTMPAPQIPFIADLPLSAASMHNHALGASETRASDGAQPPQNLFVEPMLGTRPLPGTAQSHPTICLPMPACLQHIHEAVGQRGAIGPHMMPLDRPWRPWSDSQPFRLAPVLMPPSGCCWE
jgi:hypothetical protein